MKKYLIPSQFLDRKTEVLVVGAGGTGSAVLACLQQMCLALKALGAPGLNVTVIDDDRVSPANIGRQAFAPCDVGQYKASVLVNRINLTYGLAWKARTERLSLDLGQRNDAYQLYIGCVDTRGARQAIKRHWEAASNSNWAGPALWLDCGNTASSGQVILGVRDRKQVILPSAAHLFPEMVDVALDAGDDTPSCSLPEALSKQDLFTNRVIADTAMNLLWTLFRYGELESHGAFVNLRTMRTNPLPIDPQAWARMGYEPPPSREDLDAAALAESAKELTAA